MSDYWTRMPNLAGRERGPVYTRTYKLPDGSFLAFTLAPNWMPSRRYSTVRPKVKVDGFPAVKRGYIIEGLPELRPRRQRMLRVRKTLAEAKRECEQFAAEVIAGERDPITGDARV